MPEGTKSQVQTRSRRVLVVDDDSDFAEGLDIILTSNGYQVELARNAVAAKKAAHDFAAEVALIDIRLDGSSGINLISELQALRPDILCVIMTAYASADTAIDALHKGAYDYLRKPFHSSDLLATLDRLFERITLTREKAAAEDALRARNQALEQVTASLELLVQSMQNLATCTTLGDLCPRMLEEVARNTAAEGGSIYLLEDRQLSRRHSLDPGHAPAAIPLPLKTNSVFAKAIGTGGPVLVPDLDASGDLTASGWTGYTNKSLLVFPLLGSGEDPIGVLALHSKNELPFNAQDRKIGHILTSFGCETIRVIQALEDLARNEEFLRAMAAATPVPLFVSRISDGTVLYANPQVGPALGLPRDAVVGQKLPMFFRDAAEWDSLPKLMAAQEQIRDHQCEMRKSDGTPMSIILSLQKMTYDGEAAVLGGFHDITDHKVMEEQLRQAQKMEAIGQLTGGIAHDCNNLLTIIMGNLELLAGQLPGHDKRLKYVEGARKASLRGANLTHHLLAFSRKQPLAPKAINLNKQVSGMIDWLGRTLGETIEIRTVYGAELWSCLADPAQVENAVLNLALNARDAMARGGTLVIETGNALLNEGSAEAWLDVAPGHFVMLSVTDNGSGMPSEEIERAFEPFFTTKDTGKGSGLGLSMVYGFVKQSGGHIKIDSEMGQGTVVKIYLPKAAVAEQQEKVPEIDAFDAKGVGTVLVVEDDTDVRRLAVTLLGDLGYDVLEAKDGPSALLELDRGSKVDLLFTDVVLPGGMTGRDLAEEVHRHRPEMKVLYTSGYTENVMLHDTKLAHDFDLLRKPYRKSDLAHMVHKALAGP